jgi:YidC/Oxa1 family membrane protein insertase
LFVATGNFGVAILIFIIFVKLAMFPLANKSYKSMAQMRALQPEMVKIRERYVDDQIGLHKATRDLYKREKVNPAAGCLPVLIQLIVFLALFRGLNVTIELRHAPFYGWIKDLSAADPSNLFTAFGMLPWEPPSWLHVGMLPLLYCITMIIQTAQQPKPADPVQAKMMTYMPYMMLIFFDKMASGFVLYWTWSNILSILQQHLITKRHKPKEVATDAVATAVP